MVFLFAVSLLSTVILFIVVGIGLAMVASGRAKHGPQATVGAATHSALQANRLA